MIYMFGLTSSRKDQLVLFVRDPDAIAETVRRALAEATPEERPGLERAVELIEEAVATSDQALRARWVKERLAEVGYTGPVDSVAAIKALRAAEPGLSLSSAVALAKSAAAFQK